MDRIKIKEYLLSLGIQGLLPERFEGEKWDFSKLCLKGLYLSYMDLEGTVFTLSNLKKAELRYSNLQNVDFTYADLQGADFLGSDLSGAKFTRAKLKGVNLDGCNLEGTDFFEADWGVGGVYIPRASVFKGNEKISPQITARHLRGYLQRIYQTLSYYVLAAQGKILKGRDDN